jgi:hypothetical protein
MRPKPVSNQPPRSAPQKLRSPSFLGEADLPLDLRPGELVAIAACLRSIKRKGKLSDYFEEAMQAARDAAKFLTEFKQKLVLFAKSGDAHGQLEIATVVPAHVIVRQFPAGILTFSKLLSPSGEFDKRGKPTTWLGAITTERYLRVWIQKAGRDQVLTAAEVDEILATKIMGPEQYVKLLAFQKGTYQNRGKVQAASREKKALQEKTRRTPGRE